MPVTMGKKQPLYNTNFHYVLRKLSRRGFYEILCKIEESDSMYYNDILRYAYEKKYVKTRASITSFVNILTDLQILERNFITDKRPIRTKYNLSKRGRAVLQQLKQMQREIEGSP
jgi:DNA-binding HxlR family transcriptional regulator